jgi:N-acetylneuraminic acid mutarotase
VNDGTGIGHWPARAYFQAVSKRGRMFVLGGQDFGLIPNPDPTCTPPACPPFISTSTFFNDVWSSRDGRRWERLSGDAGWAPRAGLTSVVFRDEIYVFGGSFNDDSAVIGGPPLRVYFNDVWKSRDGRTWELLTDAAPWSPRAGAAAVVKGGYIYLLGGEEGFLCQPVGLCAPPYFNDVWRTRDGVTWEEVTPSAGWSPRPGHQAVVLDGRIYVFGGFGQSQDPEQPFAAANPVDMWSSRDGAEWVKVEESPWAASGPEEIKYDFDALSSGGAIYTFGGDRETFDFFDLGNYLNVDNDVWRYVPERRKGRRGPPWGPPRGG